MVRIVDMGEDNPIVRGNERPRKARGQTIERFRDKLSIFGPNSHDRTYDAT